MRKKDIETTEYGLTPKDSTYQTGSAKPHAEHRGLIAVLMMMVIFLGGIASALGILNVRLLQALTGEKPAAENVALYVDSHVSLPPAAARDDLVPDLPVSNSVDLYLEETQGQLPAEQVLSDEILSSNIASIVTVFCGSNEEAIHTGVIVDESGFILTNAYPVACGDPVYVDLSSGERCRAALVGIDEFTDLAVLYIQAEDLTAARFASSDLLVPGDYVACIFPDGQILEGRLGNTAEYFIGSQPHFLLQTGLEAAFGPIYNSQGWMIGFASPALTEDGCALAIPSPVVKEVVEQIIARGRITGRPSLGVEVEEVEPMHQQYWHLPQGLRVTRRISQEGMLDGLLQGDILIRLGGQEITDRASLCAVLRTLQAGQVVPATVIRDNMELDLMLTIESSGE